MVGDVYRCVDSFKVDKVAFYPVTKGKVLDVDMPSPCGRFLCISHCRAPIVVLVCDGGGFLRDVKVPEDAPNK